MKRTNRILSLIDLSDYSDAIVQSTQQFSSFLHAEVIFVHQVPGVVPARASADAKENFQSARRTQAYERITEMARSRFENPPTVIVSEEELPIILRTIENNDFFNWLFIGLKETSFLEQIFLGTTAVHVINETDFVTVGFPLNIGTFTPSEIILAVYDNAVLNRKHLKKVMLQLPESCQKITLLSIAPESSNSKEIRSVINDLRDEFEEDDPASLILNGSNTYAELENFLQQKENCLLVLQEEVTPLSRFPFQKKLVSELIYKSLIPLIILPRKLP